MKKILLLLLIVFALLERTFFDLGPNVELITLVMLVSSFYFGTKEAFWITFFVLLTSDLIIGNSNIFLFTWSGFLIPAIITGKVFGTKKGKGISTVLMGTCAGITSNLFFYFWTNLGVWLLDSWNMYSNGVSGLLLSYINGLPFLKMQLTGTMIFVPVVFIAVEIKYIINQLTNKGVNNYDRIYRKY